MSDKYILIGQTPVPEPDLLTWAHWFEANGESRRVAITNIDHTTTVSTIFLGLDHAFGGGPPILFETMVFADGKDNERERCATWAEAEQMHKRMVARVRANAGR